MDAITLIAMLNMILTNIKNPDFVITESQKSEINLIIDNLDNLKQLDSKKNVLKDRRLKLNNSKNEKIVPEITIDKHAISDKRNDNVVTLNIVTKNEDGKIIPNQEIEIHTTKYGSLRSKKIKSNKDGHIVYKISIPESKILSDEEGIKIDIFTREGFEWSKNIKTIDYLKSNASKTTSNSNIKGR